MASKRLKSISGFIRRFARDERGVSAIIFAIILPMLIGMVGIAVEIGLWFEQKRDLQSAADAAAMAAAFELQEGNSAAIMQTSGESSSALNNFTDGVDGTVTINWPPLAPSDHAGDSDYVQAVLEKPQTLLFSAVLNPGGAVTLIARATATSGILDDACIIALNPTINSAVEITGSATVTMNGCGIAVNSNDSEAMTVSGSAYISAASARIVGNFDLSGGAVMDIPTVTTSSVATNDPYSGLDIGTPGSCSGGNTNQTINPSSTVTLSGTTTYCSGLDLKGTLNLNGNTLYIRGGEFKVNATASLSGTGTVIFTEYSGSYATININGSATVNISAPTSGDFKGLAMIQDPNAPAGNDNTVNGNASTSINGAIYFPNGDINYSGNTSTGSGCTRLIVYTLYLAGDAGFDNNCSAYGYSSQTGSRPILVE